MIHRTAIRAILLTPQEEILLMRVVEPGTSEGLWLMPGGGMKEGEAPEGCLRRELYEETGLIRFQLGPEVWRRAHTFPWGEQWYSQSERFFVVRVDRFEPTDRYQPEEIERESFTGFRWWPLEAIRESEEVFVPRQLASFLDSLIVDGPPPTPIDVGI